MKKVHTSEMVAHLWASQSQEEARNHQGNLYFHGDTIYSYGSHFPIARFTSKKVVLFTTRTYSKTTAKHKYIVNHAIPASIEVIACDDVTAGCSDAWGEEYQLASHEANLKAMAEELTKTLTKAAKTRLHFSTLWASAQGILVRHARYREVFGLKTKVKALTIPGPGDWLERAKETLKREAARKKARKLAQEQANAERQAKRLASYEEWIQGGHTIASFHDFPVALRIHPADTTMVQTSKGAEIPLSHAHKIWQVVEDIKAGRREEYHHNGHSLHAGSFIVNWITKDGTLQAGCHTLTYESMRAFAIKMGWVNETAASVSL